MNFKKAAVIAALTAIASPVMADYPEKPVEFVVPWPPGDLEDVLTRMIADEFQKHTAYQRRWLINQAAAAVHSLVL